MISDATQVVMIVAIVMFSLGLICLILSIVILTKQVIGRNIQTIADQTAKLAEKGITDGVSGLVGNASLLISSLNDLARSNAGIGIFFVFLSLVLLAGAYYLVKPLLTALPVIP